MKTKTLYASHRFCGQAATSQTITAINSVLQHHFRAHDKGILFINIYQLLKKLLKDSPIQIIIISI